MSMTVDPNVVIRRLENGEPIFAELPKPEDVRHPRIIGLECELNDCDKHGNPNHSKESDYYPYLPAGGHKWFPCGGKVYRDQPHEVIEICTPETSNPVEAVARMEALRAKVEEEFRKSIEKDRSKEEAAGFSLFDTSTDWDSARQRSLGSHESYSADQQKIRDGQSMKSLCPYLVARIIFTGIGHVNTEGVFELSPRARVIKSWIGEDTTSNERPLINTREFRFSLPGQKTHRLHFICGESNRNQIASFLKIGFMSLAIEMLEAGCLPKLDFDENMIAHNMEYVSRLSSRYWLKAGITHQPSWYMPSLRSRPRSALEILNLWHVRAMEVFKGRDMITDTFLVVMRYVLDKLENLQKNLTLLARMLDWAAKLGMSLLGKERSTDGVVYGSPAALDMEYHRLGPDGLGTFLQSHELAAPLLPYKVISACVHFPPQDTRANFRGWLVSRLANEKTLYFDGSEQKHKTWENCVIANRERLEPCTFRIPDPFRTYPEQRFEVEKRIRLR